MLIRVQVNDVPLASNRATWPFPTAALYSYDPVNGTAIFDVPDTDAPPNVRPGGDPTRPNTPVGPVVVIVSAADAAAWKTAQEQRYPGWQGKFGPTVK